MTTLPTLRLFDGYRDTSPEHQHAVRQAQTLLNARLMLRLKVDGYFGRSTEMAIRKLQQERGLSVDGIIGSETWSVLVVGESAELQPWQADLLRTLDTRSQIKSFQTTYRQKSDQLLAHARAAEEFRPHIMAAARAHDIQPAIIVAIGSRASGWGTLLTPKGPHGTGDHGHGRGLMQIDDRLHEFARSGKWNLPGPNINYGAGILALYRRELLRMGLEGDFLLRATLAAYNCGCANVRKAIGTDCDVDYFTSGRDYSREVWARAGWFQQFEGWE